MSVLLPMQKTSLFLCCLLGIACSKTTSTTPAPGVQEYIVTPGQTDPAIDSYNNPHYAYYASGRSPKNAVVVFLPGTGAEPKNYRAFVQKAADQGYHTIGLMYPNEPAINQLCASSGDITSHSRARLEIIDGVDRHPGIQVNAANSIINRFVKLIAYLHQAHPEEHWDQYVVNGQPAWEKIIIAGHSQGAGHAGVIGKHYPVKRVIMFSGMDFLNNGQIPDWVNNTTNSDRYYALHHVNDELVPYNGAKAGWITLGMGAPSDASTPPFTTHTFFTTAIPALPLPPHFHNMTAVDVYVPRGKLDAVWDYFLR